MDATETARAVWQRDHPDFARFFMEQVFPEPHEHMAQALAEELQRPAGNYHPVPIDGAARWIADLV